MSGSLRQTTPAQEVYDRAVQSFLAARTPREHEARSRVMMRALHATFEDGKSRGEQ